MTVKNPVTTRVERLPDGLDQNRCPFCESSSTWPTGECRVCKQAGQIRQGYIDSGEEKDVMEFLNRKAILARSIPDPSRRSHARIF